MAVTIVRTSKVGVKVGIVGRGVIEFVGVRLGGGVVEGERVSVCVTAGEGSLASGAQPDKINAMQSKRVMILFMAYLNGHTSAGM